MGYRKLSFLGILLFLSSCSINYYLCETDEEIITYYNKSKSGQEVITIPKGENVIVEGKSKYRKIKYKDSIGWAYKPIFKSQIKYNYSGSFKTTRKQKKIPDYKNTSNRTVQVKGYYRKDGTYVRPHTRRKSN